MGISEEFNSIEFDDDIDYEYVREYLDLIYAIKKEKQLQQLRG